MNMKGQEKMTHHTINSLTPWKSDVTFTGVPYPDLDRTGHWSIWGISLLFQAGRAVAMAESFMYMHKLRQSNVGHVIIKQTMELKPIVYCYTYKTPVRMRFIMELAEVGKSSVVLQTNLYDADTGMKLGTNALKFVQIDTKRRRPLPFPDWFQKEFSHVPANSGRFPEFESRGNIPKTPDDCFCWKAEIRYSDLDKNYHANQATYIKLCMDCVTAAAKAGHFRYYKSDMCNFNVESFVITYIGECFVGDTIEICVWQDKENDSKIYFSYFKGSKLIVFAEFVFGRERFKLLPPPPKL